MEFKAAKGVNRTSIAQRISLKVFIVNPFLEIS
jgi:hypothetical protein